MAKELKIVPFAIVVKRPSPFKKLLAFLIDLLLILYVFAADLLLGLSNYAVSLNFGSFVNNSFLYFLTLKSAIILTLISFTYFFIMDYLVGKTVGEFFMGIGKINESFYSSFSYALFYGLFFIFPWFLIAEIISNLSNFSIVEFVTGKKYIEFSVQQEKYLL
ncbi:MAG: hypothetical protein QXS41_03330 [Candidatus Woesearchaeota archaeon]